jgi:hypothetical protein
LDGDFLVLGSGSKNSSLYRVVVETGLDVLSASMVKVDIHLARLDVQFPEFDFWADAGNEKSEPHTRNHESADFARDVAVAYYCGRNAVPL